MLRKVCPCSGCGINTMCVSHDTISFYCNRCLAYYVRGKFYDTPKEETPQKQTIKASTKKSTKQKS